MSLNVHWCWSSNCLLSIFHSPKQNEFYEKIVSIEINLCGSQQFHQCYEVNPMRDAKVFVQEMNKILCGKSSADTKFRIIPRILLPMSLTQVYTCTLFTRFFTRF